MPSCSVHHCVLFLLTLTLTTDPGSAVCEFPIYAKLHQSVILPCEAQCSPGKAKWSLDSKRDDVFARCDQTSCTSVQQGFNMSHDKFKRGDLSLTITNPDYSMRKTYTCECGISDYATWRLKISTVFSEVQMRPGEDLKLDLSVPESVEVIYRRSVLSDGVHICNVIDRTLQCNTEYTPRTSLSNSELTLRVWRGESGTYTIRNLDYKEDIRVYAVSVSGLTTGETAGMVIAVLLLIAVLVIAAVMYYRKKAVEWEVKRLKEEVQKLIRRGKIKNTPGLLTLENLTGINSDLKKVMEKEEELEVLREKAVKEINDLEVKYRGDRKHSVYIRWFCNEKRTEMGLSTYLTVEKPTPSPESETEQFKLELEKVNKAVEKVMEPLEKARREINDLEEKYSEDDANKQYITWFCNKKRRDLGLWKDLTADSVPSWRVYIFNQDPQSLALNMEMAVRILERLRHEASAETRVIPSSDLDEMLSRAKDCLENVNSWSSHRYDMKVVAPQIQQWSEEKMEEWNKYNMELLQTPETLRNADRGELEPLV